jgi:hypothetical protein
MPTPIITITAEITKAQRTTGVSPLPTISAEAAETAEHHSGLDHDTQKAQSLLVLSDLCDLRG